MKRTVAITATVVSALLAVGVACLWIRSYWFLDRVYCAEFAIRGIPHGWLWNVHSARGGLEVGLSGDFPGNATLAAMHWGYEAQPGGSLMFTQMRRTIVERFGFRFLRVPPSPFRPPYTFVNAPHWFFFLVFGAYPAWRMREFLRRRPRPGLCICGYDLRCSTDRCPECGRPIDGNTAASV